MNRSTDANGSDQPKIRELLVSFLWLQPFETSHLERAIHSYQAVADRLAKGTADQEWQAPWQFPRPFEYTPGEKTETSPQEAFRPLGSDNGDRFWQIYLGHRAFDGRSALDCLLPFQFGKARAIDVPRTLSPSIEAWQEHYLLPLSVATVVTARLRWLGEPPGASESIPGLASPESGAPLGEVVDFVRRLFPTDCQDAGATGGSKIRPLPFDATKLGVALGISFDEDPLVSSTATKPTLITTVVDASKDAVNLDSLRQALCGFCTRDPKWKERPIADLDRHFTSPKKSDGIAARPAANEGQEIPEPTEQLGHDDGNLAIWIAKKFGPTAGRKSPGWALASYHSHQIFAALQTKAGLAALAQLEKLRVGTHPAGWRAQLRSWIERRWSADPSAVRFHEEYRPWMLGTAKLLGRLYGADESAYRTWSTYYFLSESNSRRLVNSIRERFIEPHLHSFRFDLAVRKPSPEGSPRLAPGGSTIAAPPAA